MSQEKNFIFKKIILSAIFLAMVFLPSLVLASSVPADEQQPAPTNCATGACEKCENFADTVACRRKILFGEAGYKISFLPNQQDTSTIAGRVGVVVDVVMMISGVIFFALIVYSGIQWMASAGNEETVKKAKTRITRAVIGLALVVGSWLIVSFVLSRVLSGVPQESAGFGASTGGSGIKDWGFQVTPQPQ